MLLASAMRVVAGEPQPSNREILEWMRALEPLQKTHYSWPIPRERLHPLDEMLYEYVRLTHAATLHGEGAQRAEIDAAVSICSRVNKTNPKIRASIGVLFSPWHRRFGKDLPATDRGATYAAELHLFRERCEFIRRRIAEVNRILASDVRVTAVLLDSERFHVRPGDAAWNAALDEKYNAVYDLAKAAFPGARIEWYARGGVYASAAPSGWSESKHFTLREKGDSFSCSLYSPPEIHRMRETFRRTLENARAHGVETVTPWVSLAAGYRRQAKGGAKFDFDWDYDLIYSWQLGAELNHPWFGDAQREERFAPWRYAKVVVFYPEPMGRSPAWGKHFVAYVRGAHLIRTLPGEEAASQPAATSTGD
ncbi:MAG: hypothetical protein D6744_15640 [Planctomycetota bacterium]|nr:MAG: hypothetical protein D6744_15640 [Planctomycetota bacterium]